MQDENAAFIFTYDEPLSHLIYAGADFVRASPTRPSSIFVTLANTSVIVWRGHFGVRLALTHPLAHLRQSQVRAWAAPATGA